MPQEKDLDRYFDTILMFRGHGQVLEGGLVTGLRDMARGEEMDPFVSAGGEQHLTLSLANGELVLNTTAFNISTGGIALRPEIISGIGGLTAGVVHKYVETGSTKDIISLTKNGDSVPLLAAQIQNGGQHRATMRRGDGESNVTSITGSTGQDAWHAGIFGFSYTQNFAQSKVLNSVSPIATSALLTGTTIPTWSAEDGFHLTLFNRLLTNVLGELLPSQTNRFPAEVAYLELRAYDWILGDVSSDWYKARYNHLMAERQAVGGGTFTPMA
ncbi:hypothetical protein [Oryzicola mucosus]|uniref:Uncharacterized protein n=1 Tax=Oryzicola mucosus TaxID=2767425 RepID=A0A8J6PN66_9HYPH|nr:hypothetical protein [Oryzicola mucosus]MBD0416496.1 hypothetical protein [Oryzicola mucosus]